MRVWTADQARTAILRRQGLIERFPSALDAVRALTVVQTQYAISLTPALFARAQGVTERKLARMLQKDRTLVKTWANRSTVHTLAAEDYGLLMAAIGVPFGARFRKWVDEYYDSHPGGYEAVCEAMLGAIGAEPTTRADLHERVEVLKTLTWAGWGGDVKGLAYEGKVVFASQGASRTCFVCTEGWLPETPAPPEEPLAELLRRYLAGHAPATLLDFRTWTGLDAVRCRAALKAIRDEVEDVEVESRNGVHFVPRGEEAPDAEVGKPRLLAKFDELVMGFKDRSLFVAAKHVGKVVRAAGQIEATVLLDNRIGGVWRLDRKGDRAEAVVCWFRIPAARKRRQVHREAERLGKAMGYARTDVVEREF